VSELLIYYTSQEMLKRGWMHRGKGVARPEAFDVAYDPAVANTVYLLPVKNSIEYWVCTLTERSREFRGFSFWEVWRIQRIQKTVAAKTKLTTDQKQRELESKIESKIKMAQEKSDDTIDSSNAARVAAIRENRQQAKDQERQQATGLQQESSKKKKSADVIPLTPQPDDYSYPAFIDELFGDD
jgi:hypothetical protein